MKKLFSGLFLLLAGGLIATSAITSCKLNMGETGSPLQSLVGTSSGALSAEGTATNGVVTCTSTCTCDCPAVVVDAGAVVDSGSPAVDSGSPAVDAGKPDSGTVADAGPSPADAGATIDGGAATAPVPPGWYYTEGNKIMRDGQRWMGKGVNIHDVRSCNNCAYQAPSWPAVRANIDEAYRWGARFVRLDLEAYATSGGRTHWANALTDSDYMQGLVDTVRHAGTKSGLVVMVSVWIDPSLDANGLPTGDTAKLWRRMAEGLNQFSHVWYGVANEPGVPFSFANDAAVWGSMQVVVDAIRDVEDTGPKHIIAVQGTRQWGRRLHYYVTRPMGANIVYETHIYDPQSAFDDLLSPATTLPVIIGEFGARNQMTTADAVALMQTANARQIPWTAWTFHHNCPPNLITNRTCAPVTSFTPTGWGTTLKAFLQP